MMPDLDSASRCERDDDPENCEIEITPEMWAAGASVLARADEPFSHYSSLFLQDIAAEVFGAMVDIYLEMRPQKIEQ
jgi:hypothetical protein